MIKIFSLYFLFAIGYLSAIDLYKVDSRDWLKVSIREVFISRQTTIDFKDSGSAAEFGWHLKRNNKFLSKVNDLYGNFYSPYSFDASLRLALVERDVFFDDLVATVNLEKNKTKYVLTKQNDFVILQFSNFNPDRKSGGDDTVLKAKKISKIMNNSVSFLDGDYTDHFKYKTGSFVSLLMTNRNLGDIDVLDSESLVVYPAKKFFQSAYILEAQQQNNHFRIRGAIGKGECDYQMYTIPKKGAMLKLFARMQNYLQTQDRHPSYFSYKPYALAFLAYNRDETLEICSNDSTRKVYVLFCKTVKRNVRRKPRKKK